MDKFSEAIRDLKTAAMLKAYVPKSAKKIVKKSAKKVVLKSK
jgi:hypothetical protein